MTKLSALTERFYTQLRKTMTHTVFVYGTLKRNEPNHHWLTNHQNGLGKFVADGISKHKYPLIIATRYNIPFLLYRRGEGHRVKGEIYEVDDLMLSKLDILEDHPNYYEREKDAIEMLNEDTKVTKTVDCWVYFLKKFRPDLLSRPNMDEYSSKGSHGLPYMERSKRDPNFNYIVEVRDREVLFFFNNNESTVDDLDDIIQKK